MINLIAAVGLQGQIGLNGSLPWKNSEDLKWFKSLTMGGIVVVGFNTYKNLPPLPGRTVVTMDRLKPQEVMDSCGKDLWIAGGAKTYAQWMPYIERFYISRINYSGEADTFFPNLIFKETT